MSATDQKNVSSLEELGKQTRSAARALSVLSDVERRAALEAVARGLQEDSDAITAANAQDMQAAEQEGLGSALYGRLKLDAEKLKASIQGVLSVARLADPVNNTQMLREIDTGLTLRRVTVPLGVLGIIFESRPDALIQIVSLAIKSANGIILKGGKEAVNTNRALFESIQRSLKSTRVPPQAVAMLTTREEIKGLLQLDRYVDLIIPRGSNALVKYVSNNTRIPVLGHADGICHIFVDKAANLEKAVKIIVDAKTQYPSACNALETLLVHRAVAETILPKVCSALLECKVELRCDEAATDALRAASLQQHVKPATDQDWASEYCDLVLSIKIVDSLQQAIDHINEYGSRHTECIITEDAATAEEFLGQVDAAGVYHNCSTRFADGFRYGFGAEVGISTQKMPPRGPVGLEGLVTYKYRMLGDGHIAADYAGSSAKPFSHKDLPF